MPIKYYIFYRHHKMPEYYISEYYISKAVAVEPCYSRLTISSLVATTAVFPAQDDSTCFRKRTSSAHSQLTPNQESFSVLSLSLDLCMASRCLPLAFWFSFAI